MIVNTMAAAEETAPLYDDFTPNKISSFACSLIESGEYYRAYVELIRLKSYYPSAITSSAYDITSNYLFYKSKNYHDLLVFNSAEISDEIYIPLSLFKIDSYIKMKKNNDAELELIKLYERPDSKYYMEYLKKRSFYLSILNNQYDESIIKDKFTEYKDLFIYSESIYEKRKNPFLGTLAGIIPGMGFVYAGESGTGIVSMIMIGLGSAVTYGSNRNDLDSVALISGVITFFFYGGSIAGGYMQTNRYNDRLMETLEMKVNRELMPEKDLEEIYFKFGLNSNDCK